MKIECVDLKDEIINAVQKEFDGVGEVSARKGSILDVECDAVVSPANSFGFMDGGIDLAYSDHFGWDLQKRLQRRIIDMHHGELLVGMADIVETGDEKIPYLIAAPTMRVPSVIGEVPNAYLAMRAVLLLLKHGSMDGGKRVRDVVKTLAIPGLGTGIGKMPSRVCARQMRRAWNDVMSGVGAFPGSCREAWRRHERMVAGLIPR